jgi:uncharacterized caspase-like protein
MYLDAFVPPLMRGSDGGDPSAAGRGVNGRRDMAKRALLIGSQTGALTGVHADVELMDETLTAAGFSCRSLTGTSATRDGIIAGYLDLIEDTRADDAVVTFYSGHGGRERNLGRAADAQEPEWLQYIVPTDIDDRSGDGFRGILAAELGLLQARLTDRTRNVTTIVDCCHAARMFRRRGGVPKADPTLSFPLPSVRTRWAKLRGSDGVAPTDANPHAVQVVACQPDESAYEVPLPGVRRSQGALTVALVEVLRSASASTMSWREVLGVVRRRVAGVVAAQTPSVAGGTAAIDRLVFTLDGKSAPGALPVFVEQGVAWLLDAGLLGLAVGDVYALVRPGGDAARPRTRGTIDRLAHGRARLALDRGGPTQLPAGTTAHPISGSLSRRPVAVVPVGHPAHETVGDLIAKEGGAPVVAVRDGALAVVELDDAGVRLVDGEGLPYTVRPHELTAAGLAEVTRSVRTLARADYLRELRSGEGDDELPDDVEIGFARLDPTVAGGEEALGRSGEHMFVGDRFVVRATNHADEQRFVSILDIGLRGGVFLMTDAERMGVTLAPGETYVLGESAVHARAGIQLFWPDGLPPEGARPESYVVLVTDARIEGLTSLAQPGLVPRGPGWEKPLSGLERLIADAGSGRREGRLLAPPTKPTRYRVHRLDLLLHPEERPDAPVEPAFHVDAAADRSFRLVPPRSALAPPRRLSIRLAELAFTEGSSLACTGAVRIDVLALTAAAGADGMPFQTRTVVVDPAGPGAADGVPGTVLFDGPVGRFVDLAMWMSTTRGPVSGLAELLAPVPPGSPMSAAVGVLVGLGAPEPPAALVARAEAAVATIVRGAAEALGAVAGTSVGIYRTTLLPHDRFGSGPDGPPVSAGRRHPAIGTLRAGAAELALEIQAPGS